MSRIQTEGLEGTWLTRFFGGSALSAMSGIYSINQSFFGLGAVLDQRMEICGDTFSSLEDLFYLASFFRLSSIATFLCQSLSAVEIVPTIIPFT